MDWGRPLSCKLFACPQITWLCLWLIIVFYQLNLLYSIVFVNIKVIFFPEIVCKAMTCCSLHLLIDWVIGVQWEIAIACRKIMKLLWRISSELFNLIQNSHMRIPFVVMSMRQPFFFFFFLSSFNLWKWNSPTEVLFSDSDGSDLVLDM